jgi:hypothetical protein
LQTDGAGAALLEVGEGGKIVTPKKQNMAMEYKYDVAFSCAEEDIAIAQKIAEQLLHRGISYYLYTEHKSENWGQNIFRISIEKYGKEARFILALISKIYVTKHWSGIEMQIAQSMTTLGAQYILPLKLDDVAVDGLSKNIDYMPWNDNAAEIAALILEKKDLEKKKYNNNPPVNQKPTAKYIAEVQNFATVIETQRYNFNGK